MSDSEERMEELEKRVDELEREIRLLHDPDYTDKSRPMVDVEGGFFQVMNALRSLYLDEEGDQEEIRRLSERIESGDIKVDVIELFFRFFIRQEIQNARIKLILLSQRFDIRGDLFDHLEDLQMLIDDPRYSVHQVVIGWKRFEREAASEIKRLQAGDKKGR